MLQLLNRLGKPFLAPTLLTKGASEGTAKLKRPGAARLDNFSVFYTMKHGTVITASDTTEKLVSYRFFRDGNWKWRVRKEHADRDRGTERPATREESNKLDSIVCAYKAWNGTGF